MSEIISTDITTAQLFGQTDSHITWLSEHIGIHHQMLKPLNLMQAAAQQDDIDITIASGFRHFERQLSIWNRKVTGQLPVNDLNNQAVDLTKLTSFEQLKAILLYSALPATSRHHWGCDIDVYAQNALGSQQLKLECWEYEPQGPFYSLSCWLDKYAADFGFYRPYQQYQKGVAPEPWHLSYAPLSVKFEKKFTDIGIAPLSSMLAASELQLKTTVLEQLPFIVKQYVNNISEFKNG